MEQELLQRRKQYLSEVIKQSLPDSPIHSRSFVARIMGETYSAQQPSQLQIQTSPEEIAYFGYPDVAHLGFCLNVKALATEDVTNAFIVGIKRLQQRSSSSLADFTTDDLALLGVAEGIAKLSSIQDLNAEKEWLLQLVEAKTSSEWTSRMRALAGELLDSQGRLKVTPRINVDTLALESVLRGVWPSAFYANPPLSIETLQLLLKSLLSEEPPQQGDLERAAVWLKALDTIVDVAVTRLLPNISDTVLILRRVQHAMKRWVWEKDARRRNTQPSRWLIDNEYDVQALLWLVLYPIYESELVDEAYLPNWGNVQPRADLGIISLKLIVEVKIARSPSDFAKIEGEIGGDLGLYFKETDLFDRMIVFVYDDCDSPQPEKHDSLRNALTKRERIEDVVIVQRPSMIPNRGVRAG
jgi:hypothetical protein